MNNGPVYRPGGIEVNRTRDFIGFRKLKKGEMLYFRAIYQMPPLNNHANAISRGPLKGRWNMIEAGIIYY